MKKIIIRILIFFISTTFVFLIYLSTFGIKTDKLNNQISSQIKNIDKNFAIPHWHRLVSINTTAGREPESSDTRAACLLFTSGSTGEPKGIRIKHSNIISYVKSIQKIYKPNETDRFSQIFDQTFDLSLHDMFVAWSTGASLFCIPDEERHAPGRFIKRHSLTFWFSTPSTIALMQSAKLLKINSFPTLRFSLFCGEPLSSELAKNWMIAAPNSRLHNLYGPTEATIAITQTKITKKLLNNVLSFSGFKKNDGIHKKESFYFDDISFVSYNHFNWSSGIENKGASIFK